ncbi:FHA domain-containing protein [Epibacterium ulvae]|nr:FHA domain-containing protein [Epibacterium ulvae]
MRVVETTPKSQGPALGAAFPEPAFAETAAAAGVDLGEADLGLPMGRAGRVKTRLLGFDADVDAGDPFAQTGVSDDGGVTQFPVGWLVVVDGPGRGAGFTLFAGVSVIGRGEGQTVRLDFGDSSISRDQHAAIAYDPEQQGFFIGHGGKANLVRRNGRPVLSTEALAPGDVIRVGATTLRFVPLCGPEFSWQDGAHLG